MQYNKTMTFQLPNRLRNFTRSHHK